MCPPGRLPPGPYCNQEWESIMQELGMVCAVTPEMFVWCARKLEAESLEGMTYKIVNKSLTLMRHFSRRTEMTFGTLQELKEIRFVYSSAWASTAEGKLLVEIAKPFGVKRLVCFSETCGKSEEDEDDVYVAWSSRGVIPRQYFPPAEFEDILSFRKTPPEEAVVEHVQNLCQALTGTERERIFKLEGSVDLLKKVFFAVYQRLSKVSQTSLTRLRQLPIVLDVENKLMLQAGWVVVNLREEEGIAGYIMRAPREFDKFFGFFKSLGATDLVTANHYALTLSGVRKEAAAKQLHVEEMKTVKLAVEGLFRCLKSSDPHQKCLAVKDLYLPSEDAILESSTDLVFIDNNSIRERLRELPNNTSVFLGFQRLEIEVPVPVEEIRMLPVKYQMKMLSRLVKEVVSEDTRNNASTGPCSKRLAEKLKNPLFVHAVTRLVYHHTRSKACEFSSKDADEIKQRLSRISVREVACLKTILICDQKAVEGSEEIKMSFVEKNGTDMGSCTVFVSENSSGISEMADTVIHSLVTALEFVLKSQSCGSYLHIALRNTAEALKLMDDAGIVQCDFRNLQDVQDDSVFPHPGAFIPIKQHPYLDNNFYEFYHGEHVGFESYDAELDAEASETSAAEDIDAVYLYAVVLEEINQGAGNIPLLDRRYRIDLGPLRGTAEVSVTQLYKFIRKPTSGKTSKPPRPERPAPTQCTPNQRARTETSNTAFEGEQEEEKPPPLDLKTVLRDLRETLAMAWRYPETDFLRVVKRLLLKWHPDKNKGNETFCTQVFQELQRYVDLRKQGKELPGDEEEGIGRPPNQERPSSDHPSSSASFFEHMRRRGRAYSQRSRSSKSEDSRRDQYDSSSNAASNAGASSHRSRSKSRGRSESASSSADGGREPSAGYRYTPGARPNRSTRNAQPAEGRRWFRQAEADFSAAQMFRCRCDEGRNWICYLCHQAAEKALKAVLYHRDADGDSLLLQSHDLSKLAVAVSDLTLIRLAKRLEGQVGNHTRMRYPVQLHSTIPAGIYTNDQAKAACDIVTQVLQRVQGLQLRQED